MRHTSHASHRKLSAKKKASSCGRPNTQDKKHPDKSRHLSKNTSTHHHQNPNRNDDPKTSQPTSDIRYQKATCLRSNPDIAPHPERIAKYLARQGIGSRRDVERFILEGRIKVDKTLLTTPAYLVTNREMIEFDGKQIGKKQHRRKLWLYHKPVGLITTHNDPQGRPTVFETLPETLPRVISVGRLDLNSEGLLLLTNDGSLAHYLELPDTGWQRSYRVRIQGHITETQLKRLKKGMTLEGISYRAIEAQIEHSQNSNMWLQMTLSEGKNREIRKIMTALGVRVNRLIRLAYGPFQLDHLPKGAIKQVSLTDMNTYGLLSLPCPTQKTST